MSEYSFLSPTEILADNLSIYLMDLISSSADPYTTQRYRSPLSPDTVLCLLVSRLRPPGPPPYVIHYTALVRRVSPVAVAGPLPPHRPLFISFNALRQARPLDRRRTSGIIRIPPGVIMTAARLFRVCLPSDRADGPVGARDLCILRCAANQVKASVDGRFWWFGVPVGHTQLLNVRVRAGEEIGE